MKLEARREVQRAVLAFCFCIPLPLIAVMVHWNPSHSEPGNPFATFSVFLLFAFCNAAGLLLVTWILLKVRDRGLFETLFALAFFLLLAYGIGLALRVHRDFFTYVFQHILSFWLIFCRRLEGFSRPTRAKTTLRYMRTVNIVVFALTSIWLILMGYAVCIRAEPRWIESMLYNAYNLVLVFLLIIMTSHLGTALYKRVSIDGKSFVVEGHDFSTYMSDADKRLAVQFLSAQGRSIPCSEVSAALEAVRSGSGGRTNTWDCATCQKENYPVYKCPKYRAAYNRVLSVKKLFEALEIGDILSPGGQAAAKKSGWKLRLFDDVRLRMESATKGAESSVP